MYLHLIVFAVRKFRVSGVLALLAIPTALLALLLLLDGRTADSVDAAQFYGVIALILAAPWLFLRLRKYENKTRDVEDDRRQR